MTHKYAHSPLHLLPALATTRLACHRTWSSARGGGGDNDDGDGFDGGGDGSDGNGGNGGGDGVCGADDGGGGGGDGTWWF